MNQNAIFALCFVFSIACSLSAQINVPLRDGSSFLIEGRQVLNDPNRGNCYLRETTDTLHYYVHKTPSKEVFSLEHYRIPMHYLSKDESRKTKAKFSLRRSENSVIAYEILSFHCTEKNNDMYQSFHSHFSVTYYSQSETGRKEHICHFSMYFTDKIEAKNTFKRIKELAK